MFLTETSPFNMILLKLKDNNFKHPALSTLPSRLSTTRKKKLKLLRNSTQKLPLLLTLLPLKKMLLRQKSTQLLPKEPELMLPNKKLMKFSKLLTKLSDLPSLTSTTKEKLLPSQRRILSTHKKFSILPPKNSNKLITSSSMPKLRLVKLLRMPRLLLPLLSMLKMFTTLLSPPTKMPRKSLPRLLTKRLKPTSLSMLQEMLLTWPLKLMTKLKLT